MTLRQMNLSCSQGVPVYLLHRFSLCFFSLPGTGCCQVYGSAVQAAAPASDHGCSQRVLEESSLVGNLRWGEVGKNLQHLSAFKEVMVLPPIMHSKPQTPAVTSAVISAILFKQNKTKQTKRNETKQKQTNKQDRGKTSNESGKCYLWLEVTVPNKKLLLCVSDWNTLRLQHTKSSALAEDDVSWNPRDPCRSLWIAGKTPTQNRS